MTKALVISGYGDTGIAAHFVHRTLNYIAKEYAITYLTPVREKTAAKAIRKYYTGDITIASEKDLFYEPDWITFSTLLRAKYDNTFDAIILIGLKGSHIPVSDIIVNFSKDINWKSNWSPAMIDHRKLYAFDLLIADDRIHYIIDPLQDVHLSPLYAKRYYFYDMKYEGMPLEYKPFVEESCEIANEGKVYDLVFGCTADFDPTGNRNKFIQKMLQLSEAGQLGNHKLFFKSKKLELDTFVKHEEYMYYIKRAKNTVIIPSNDISQFSAFRYWEAKNVGCQPLLLPEVNFDGLIQHHPKEDIKYFML